MHHTLDGNANITSFSFKNIGKKVLYGKVREDVHEILNTLCKYKNVEIIAVQSKWDKAFWARGYYVETIGNITDEAVQKYIKEQAEESRKEDSRSTAL